MPKVSFTSALKRFFPTLQSIEVNGENLPQIIHNINIKFPGIQDYILEQDGSLRKHVNIFIAGELITDRNTLTDQFDEQDEIYIFQALSGG